MRRIAREQGFETASKRDSQGICFVPGNDFASFIERRRGHALPEGAVVGMDGALLGGTAARSAIPSASAKGSASPRRTRST